MQLKDILIFFLSLAMPFFLFSQCPDKSAVWNQIIEIRDNEKDYSRGIIKLAALKNQFNNCASKDDSVYAYLLQRIGVSYFNKNEFTDAIQSTKGAIDILEKNREKESVNLTRLVDCYYYQATYYRALQIINEKNKAIDSCMANSLRTGYGFLYSLYLWIEYVNDILGRGDYQQCINNVNLGITLARSNSFPVYVYQFTVVKINALISLKQYSEAEALLKSAINEFKAGGEGIFPGQLYEQLAELELQNNKPVEALIYFNESLRVNKAINYNIGYQETLTNLGYVYYFKYKRDFAAALKAYNEAIKELHKNGTGGENESAELLNLYANKAIVYAEINVPDSAFHYFQLAFDIVKPGLNEEVSTREFMDACANYSRIDFIVPMIIDKADACLNFYKKSKGLHYIKQALKIYKAVDLLLSTIRSTHTEVYSKLFWRTETRRLYEHAIDACFILNDTEQAFYFFEKSKAAVLSDQLKSLRFLKEEDMLRLAQVRVKINRLEASPNLKSLDNDTHPEIQKELFETRQQLTRLQQEIQQKTPLYYQVFMDTAIVSLKGASAALLKNKQSLLEFFNGDSVVYSLLVTQGSAYLNKLPKAVFDTYVSSYKNYLYTPATMNINYDGYIQTASQLYQLIFQNNTALPGRIIISPDGLYFPFESLVTSKRGEPVKYFIEDHAVSYTYSARFLLNDFYANSTNAGKSFLGIAPIKYPASFSLASLEGSEKSLNTIAGNFSGASNFVSSNASRSNFLLNFSEYKIIQLYTHAAENSKNNEPVIYFADSLLYLSDLIGETKPLTKLIVLSACETGLGKEYKGEGVFSFNRGFAALGIPSSITNLWTIDNESTYKITELFYKYIADGFPLDEALQKAKIDFIKTSSKEKQLPYYWAAAVLVGNTDAITIQKNRNWPLYILTIGVPALIFILFLAIRKGKKLIPIQDTAETVS